MLTLFGLLSTTLSAQKSIFSGDNTDIHMPTDDAEKIEYDFIQRSCRHVYEIIMEPANGNDNLQ